MKRFVWLTIIAVFSQYAAASGIPFGKGQLIVKKVAQNAVRIQYVESEKPDLFPDWSYVDCQEVESDDIGVKVDAQRMVVEVTNKEGRAV